MPAKMSSSQPARKITVAALGGAITTVLLFVLPVEKWIGKEITPGIEAAFTTIIIFIVGYLIPPSSKDQIVDSETGEQIPITRV